METTHSGILNENIELHSILSSIASLYKRGKNDEVK